MREGWQKGIAHISTISKTQLTSAYIRHIFRNLESGDTGSDLTTDTAGYADSLMAGLWKSEPTLIRLLSLVCSKKSAIAKPSILGRTGNSL
jgi:hypothetical protein